MNGNLQKRLNEAGRLLAGAERIVIGGGAGLSAAAGLAYTDKQFTENFVDFIRK